MLRIRFTNIILLFTVFFIFIFSSTQTRAEENESDVTQEEKGEYDFSWLDPDKKIYVVQNRKYTKAKHLETVLSGGFGFGEPYRSSWIFLPRAIYYFNESWGVSALGLMASNSENDNVLELKEISASSYPNVRDVQSFFGGSVVWVPFYAKINAFNRIFYIDWSWEAGVASVNTELDLNFSTTGTPNLTTSTHMGFFWGTGQKFFITKSFAARFDLLGLYYSAPTARRGVLSTTNQTNSNYYFTVGMSYTF